MSSEEDLEVILEGGELHNYFQSLGTDICDVYSSKQSTTNVTQMDSGPPSFENSKFVLKEVMEIVNAILRSKLLLEEDAIYLFQNLNELIPQNKNIMSLKLLLPGIIIAISSFGSWKSWNLKKFCFTVVGYSTVMLLYGMKDIIMYIHNKDNIKQIVNNLQLILAFIRKNIKLIQEEDSLINSKQKVLNLRNNENIVNYCTIKRKRVEIFNVSKKLISILKYLIFLSRKMTLDVCKLEKQKSSIHIIALYSDEQLGINKDYKDLDEETNMIPFINSLKNIYIMMQSETLRTLGLCLCGFTEAQEISELFNELHHYILQSSSILLELKNLHETHFFPVYVPKQMNSVNNNVRYLYAVVNSISSTSNGLLFDSRKLQDFIDENSEVSIDTTSQIVGQKLLDMERDLAYLLEHIHASSQQLLKQNICNNPNQPLVINQTNDRIIRTGLSVGISDFTVKGSDEVFLGYIEGNESCMNINEYDDEYVKPTYHNVLMSELKATLISKREDFEKREIKVLKSKEDLENYNACTTEYKLSDSQNSNRTNFTCSTIINENISASNSVVEEVNVIHHSLNKDVAIKAIGLLNTWNKKFDEECFGDEECFDVQECFSNNDDG